MVERIRQLLTWQQLSPTQFADFIGVGRPVISHILSERNKPSLEVVQRIIAAFPAVSLSWLLSGAGTMLAGSQELSASTSAESPAVSAVSLPASAVLEAARPAAVNGQAEKPATAGDVAVITASKPFAPVAMPRAAPPAARFVASQPTASYSEVTRPAINPNSSAEAPLPVSEALLTSPLAASQLTAALLPSQVPVPEASPALTLPPLPASVPTIPRAADEAASLAAALLTGPEKAIRRIVIFYRDGSFADYVPEG